MSIYIFTTDWVSNAVKVFKGALNVGYFILVIFFGSTEKCLKTYKTIRI